MAAAKVYVNGVGMTKFRQPNAKPTRTYPELAKEAGTEALRDAGITYDAIHAVVVSYNYGEPTSGQKAVYELGLTGVPVFNVNNNCSAGSSALMLARHLVQSGVYENVLALGFEQMEGGLTERFTEKVSPVQRHFDHMDSLSTATINDPGIKNMNDMTRGVIRLFAEATQEYMAQNPACSVEDFARIAVKNRRVGRLNPKACFYGAPEITQKDALNRPLCSPITMAMTAMTADGAAAAVLSRRPGAVELVEQAMCTDLPSSFGRSLRALSGYEMSRNAAQTVFRKSGLSPSDVDLLEVHDCFSSNELFMYEAMGLCPQDRGYQLVRTGVWETNREGGKVYRLGNRWVVNPSGGLQSKGHPIGATGLAQCFEIVKQLRGEAGIRQVDDARVGLQHNFGIGGAAVVSLYRTTGVRSVPLLKAKL